MQHLQKFTPEYKHYFPRYVSKYSWVQNPFNVDEEDLLEDTDNIPMLQD
jgi:hypothetical protein